MAARKVPDKRFFFFKNRQKGVDFVHLEGHLDNALDHGYLKVDV